MINKILTNWKNWTIVCLIVLLGISALINKIEHTARLRAEKQDSSKGDQLSTVVNAINRTKDKNGNEHATFKSNQNQLSRAFIKESRKLDTIASLLDIKKKDIIDYTKIGLVITASDLKGTVVKDSSNKISKVIYKDRTFGVTYYPIKNEADTNIFDLSANIDLNNTSYRKRNMPIIGRYITYTDIWASDKRIKIAGIDKLTIKQEEPQFGLRIQGVANYSFSRDVINMGPGLQFDFGRFSAIGTYYYDLGDKVWRPSIGIRLDAIRF